MKDRLARRLLIFVAVCSACLLEQSKAFDDDKPTPEVIARAVRDLGAESYADREKASQTLWRAGRLAENALRKASGSDDAEVAWRARAILKDFQLGIFPETPQEVVRQVRYYLAEANVNSRLKILQQIQVEGQHRMALRLILYDDGPQTRDALTPRIAPGVISFAQQLIGEEKLKQAEEILRLGAYTGADELIHSYIVFLHVSEKLSDALMVWEKTLDARKPQRSVFDDPLREEVRDKLLIAGLRMQNRLEEAMTLAQRRESFRDLQLNIAFERRDWPQVATLHKASQPSGSRTARRFVEWLGFAATFDRLAGNTESFEKHIAELIETGKKKTSVDIYSVEALLINERFDEAIEVAQVAEVNYAFRLLCAQYRYRDAFRMAGWEDVDSPDRSWIAPLVIKAKSSKWREMALDMVREMRRLGMKERAQQLFDALMAGRRQTSASRLTTSARYAVQADMIDQADRFAAKALAIQLSRSVWSTLYPKDAPTAASWWQYFLQTAERNPAAIKDKTEKEQAILELVQRVRYLMTPARAVSLDGAALEGWLSSAAEYEMKDAGRSFASGADWVYLVGRSAAQHGKMDLARRFYEKAAHQSAKAAIAVGDLQRAEGQHGQSVKSYRRAVQIDPQNALARYLLFMALEQTGDSSSARRQRMFAEMLPLATRGRHDLSEGLRLRQLEEHARRQWRIGLRAGNWRDYYVGISARYLGFTARKTDPAQALDYYHEYWLAFLRTDFRFTLIASHLHTSVSLDKYRALELLSEGKRRQAVERLRRAMQTISGYLPLIQEMVPQLDKHKLGESADEFFNEAFSFHEQLLRDFPHSGWLHNNLAWTCALCNRRLDQALEFARRAAKLAPENPAHLHTLAEVHFRRGDRDKALELVRQCIERTPYTNRYRPDLKRYSGEDLNNRKEPRKTQK